MRRIPFLPFLAAAIALTGCGSSEGHDSAPPTSDERDLGTTTTTSVSPETDASEPVAWEFDGSNWQARGDAPACADPLDLPAPADLATATAVLYPGQMRGGNYKPHGGLMFHGTPNNAVTVTLPLDAIALRGSRYVEAGETQYMFDFVASCGIMMRFDHLLVLSPELEALAAQLPEPVVDDSRTTAFPSSEPLAAGTTLATGVGFRDTPPGGNTFFDFGVYDLRTQNATAQADPSYAQNNGPELAPYARCWLDLLSAADRDTVRALPPGDAASGDTSDYC